MPIQFHQKRVLHIFIQQPIPPLPKISPYYELIIKWGQKYGRHPLPIQMSLMTQLSIL